MGNTREEYKLMINRKATIQEEHTVMNSIDVEDLVDIIVDDFESRICKNCKYYGDDPEEEGELKCLLHDIAFVETFGCNEFKRKDK